MIKDVYWSFSGSFIIIIRFDGFCYGQFMAMRYKFNLVAYVRMDLQEVGGSCGDWMELAQDRDRWRVLVGTVRNLRVPKMRGIS
jgi:hypothetical protein